MSESDKLGRREFLIKSYRVSVAYLFGYGVFFINALSGLRLPTGIQRTTDNSDLGDKLAIKLYETKNIDKLEEIIGAYFDKYQRVNSPTQDRQLTDEEVQVISREVTHHVSQLLEFEFDKVIYPQSLSISLSKNLPSTKINIFKYIVPGFTIALHALASALYWDYLKPRKSDPYDLYDFKETLGELNREWRTLFLFGLSGFTAPLAVKSRRYWSAEVESRANFIPPDNIEIGGRWRRVSTFYDAYSHILAHYALNRNGTGMIMGQLLNEGVARCVQEETAREFSERLSLPGLLKTSYVMIIENLINTYFYLSRQSQRPIPKLIENIRHHKPLIEQLLPEIDFVKDYAAIRSPNPHTIGTAVLKLLQEKHGQKVYKNIFHGDLSAVNGFLGIKGN
ncbi:hypothetical protein HYS31_08280 [Candidatus Woesearchaeota archaeon]|nr:hypothetical protein [Candidatus Woesearchaeota archaeon]